MARGAKSVRRGEGPTAPARASEDAEHTQNEPRNTRTTRKAGTGGQGRCFAVDLTNCTNPTPYTFYEN